MSWRKGPRQYGMGQQNPFQKPPGPRPNVQQPGPWSQNTQGQWQQNPGQVFRNPNAQGQRFQAPQQNGQNNLQNNTDYCNPSKPVDQ